VHAAITCTVSLSAWRDMAAMIAGSARATAAVFASLRESMRSTARQCSCTCADAA
jgi:hypothetical protein